MNLETLSASLTTMGVAHVAFPSGSDGAVLFLPDYGRILGVWPHWRADNALWVNPAFLDLLRLGVKDDGWMNPGGDRMWLGPEEEFIPEKGDVPAAIDPGRYARTAARVGFAMENRGEVRAWKSDLRVRFRVVRHVRVLGEPELSAAWGESWLRRAGYEEETTLEVDGERPACLWLWNCTQVPPDAEFRLSDRASANGEWNARGDHAETGYIALCIERTEQGRAHLVAKRFDPDGTTCDRQPLLSCHQGDSRVTGEFSCSSASLPSHGKQRILWKTGLCAYSGRIDEIEALAARILS
jgi:hypothetical protein